MVQYRSRDVSDISHIIHSHFSNHLHVEAAKSLVSTLSQGSFYELELEQNGSEQCQL